MNKAIQKGILGLALITSPQVFSADFTSTFTTDNEVTGFSYSVNGASTVVDLSGVSGLSDWTQSSDLALTIADGSDYQFIWDIVNYGTISSGNPVAFLGEFTLNGDTYFTDDLTWEVNSAYTNGWEIASLNLGGGTDAFNQGDNIWGTRAPGDISSNAQWIWDGAANGQNDTMSFRATVVSAVPEPTTYAMMLAGLGLVGFMASRRKKA